MSPKKNAEAQERVKPVDVELRRKAETKLKAQGQPAPAAHDLETQRLVQELQIHQIELELQNEELTQSRAEVETVLRQYADLHEFAPVGYFTLEKNIHIQKVNLIGALLLGMERVHLMNRHLAEYVAAEHRPVFNTFLKKVLAARAQETCELLLLKKGHENFWAQIEAVCAEDGETIQLVIMDINERKQSEEKLIASQTRLQELLTTANLSRQVLLSVIEDRDQVEAKLRTSEARYRSLIENQYEAIVRSDISGRLTFVNDVYCQTFNKTREELIGQISTPTVAPEDEHIALGVLERIQKPPYRMHTETRHLTLQGIRWFEWENSAILDESKNVVEYQSVARDVTERKHAEQALKEERNILRTLIDNLPDRIYVMDTEGRKILSNTADWMAAGGKTMADIIGKTDFDSYPPELAEEFWQVDRAVLDSGAPIINFEEPGLDFEGNQVSILTTKVPLFDGQGKVTGLVGIGRDITERKRRENALRESEALYRQAIEVAGAVPYSESYYDDGSKIKYEFIGEGIRQITGYGPEEFSAKIWDSLVEEVNLVDDLAGYSLEEGIQRVRSGEYPIWKCEHRIRARDGKIHWVFEAAIELYDENGLAYGSIGTYQDVTARKQAEETLRESENRFASIFHTNPNPVSITSFEDGRFLEVNEAFLNLSGYSHQEVIGHTSLELNNWVEPLEPVRLRTLLEEQGRVQNFESHFRQKSGDTVDVLLSAELIELFGQRCILMVGLDVTEQKQNERKLLESNERFRQLADNIQEAFWITDAKSGEDIYISQAAETIWGRSVADLMKTPDAFATYILPEDLPMLTRVIELQRKGQKTEVEYRMTRPDGTVRWIWDRAFPILDDTGKTIHVAGIAADVTERKWAEDALRASEERFRSLFDRMLDGVYRSTHAGRFIDVNPAMVKMFRYASRAEMLAVDIKHDLYFEPAERGSHVLDTGQEEIDVYRMRRKDGSEIWVEDRGSYVHDEQGNIIYHEGILRDVTERKQAENELRQSEERYRGLFEDSPISLWEEDFSAVKQRLDALREQGVTDFKSHFESHPQEVAELVNLIKVVDVNKATLELYGAKSKEALLKNLTQVFHEDSRECFVTELVYLIKGCTQFVCQGVNQTLDGKLIHINLGWSVAAGHENDLSKVVVSIVDITEQKKAELEIKHHLSELEVLYESGLAISRLLEPGEIGKKMIEILEQKMDWHHAAVRLYDPQSDRLELIALGDPRYKAAELEAQITRLNQLITNSNTGLSGWAIKHGEVLRVPQVKQEARYIETFPGIQSGLYVPIGTGGHIIGSIAVESELENAFTEADERLLQTIANQAAIAIENAQLYALAQAELEEREKAQTELEKIQSDLERRVESRTEDFKLANINLARALRVKDEFLANMSHELRTPLNAILGLSESLAEQTAGPLNDKQQKYLATVTESGRHLLSLINDILDLAKIDAGQIKLELGKVDIQSVCDASLRMIKQLAQKKNQSISLNVENGLGLMWADERRLKQMLVNLLSNAVKFTPNDGKLGLEVHGNADENTVTFTIFDTGIGIKEADLPRLFQSFIQLDSGLARESSGTGLGLVLVAQMARLHGGSAGVISQPGKGSQFSIMLPWEPALIADDIERLKTTGKFRPIKLKQGQIPTVLLIEDTEEVVMLISDYLEQNGFKVFTAQDGIEGVNQAELMHPDVILMDIQMPRMDGFEATKKLRSQPAFANTPIIALTALAMANDRERCLAAGMDEYITKPVHLRGLVKIIETFLGGETEIKHS